MATCSQRLEDSQQFNQSRRKAAFLLENKMQKISFSGKMLFVGPLIKTSYEIPVAGESQSGLGKPALACTNGFSSTQSIDTEIARGQDHLSLAGLYKGQGT